MKASVKDYEDLVVSSGEKVKVHRVQTSLVKGVIPDVPRPRRPQIEMTIAGNKKQLRPAKEGDPEYLDYEIAKLEWEDLKSQLQDDVTLCLALKSYPIPEGALKFSSEIQELIDDGLLPIPQNKWNRKAAWLRDNVIVTRDDELQLQWTMSKLDGIPEEIIEEQKASFWNSLRRQDAGTVGPGTDGVEPGQADGDDELSGSGK